MIDDVSQGRRTGNAWLYVLELTRKIQYRLR
jgi:hypothetical protein